MDHGAIPPRSDRPLFPLPDSKNLQQLKIPRCTHFASSPNKSLCSPRPPCLEYQLLQVHPAAHRVPYLFILWKRVVWEFSLEYQSRIVTKRYKDVANRV